MLGENDTGACYPPAGNEHEEAFAATLDAINRHYQPETDLERELCVEIAHHRWPLRRLWIIETGLFDKEMDKQTLSFPRPLPPSMKAHA